MDRYQTAKLNSLVKSDDFLTDNATALAGVTQIATEAAKLHALIENIMDADAIASRDLAGVAEAKQSRRAALEQIMRKLGKSASAYFYSINNMEHLRITEHTASELSRMSTEEILVRARDLFNLCTPVATMLIGAGAADLSTLTAAKTALADSWEDPKRAIEKSKAQRDAIPGYIAQADRVRIGIDIYMQTFEDDQPLLYAEWKLSMGIDDAATHSEPDLVVPVMAVGSGAFTGVPYDGLTLSGAADIKVTSLASGEVRFGFGIDHDSIVAGKAKLLVGGESGRYTAAVLGFDGSAVFLNIQNDNPGEAELKVEFFVAD